MRPFTKGYVHMQVTAHWTRYVRAIKPVIRNTVSMIYACTLTH